MGTRLKTTPPDGGYGWVIVLAGFVIFTIVGGTSYSFGVLFVALLDAFGGSKADTALVGSLFAGFAILGHAFALPLCSKFGHRRVVIGAGIGAAISMILSSFTTNIQQIAFTYGFMASLCYWTLPFLVVTMVSKYFKKRLSLAMGIALSGAGFGQFIFSVGIQILLNTYGWRGTLLLLAGLTLNICVGGALLRPLEADPSELTELHNEGNPKLPLKSQELNETSEMRENTTGRPENIDSSKVEKNEISYSKSQENTCCYTCGGYISYATAKVKKYFTMIYDINVLRDTVVLLFLLTSLGQGAGHYTVFTHVVKRARDFGLSAIESSSLPAVTGLTQCIGRIFWGILGERFKKLKPYYFYGFSMGLCGVATLISIYTKTFAGQLTYMILFGFGIACYIPMFPVVLFFFLGPEKYDSGLSMFMQLQGLGAILMSPFVGWLRDIQGDYVTGFYLVAVIYFVCAVLSILPAEVQRCLDKKKADLSSYELDSIKSDVVPETQHLRANDGSDISNNETCLHGDEEVNHNEGSVSDEQKVV